MIIIIQKIISSCQHNARIYKLWYGNSFWQRNIIFCFSSMKLLRNLIFNIWVQIIVNYHCNNCWYYWKYDINQLFIIFNVLKNLLI